MTGVSRSQPSIGQRLRSFVALAKDVGMEAKLVEEAADEIESLRAQLEGTQESFSSLAEQANKLVAQLASARKALQWIANSPSAHPANMVKVAEDGLKEIAP